MASKAGDTTEKEHRPGKPNIAADNCYLTRYFWMNSSRKATCLGIFSTLSFASDKNRLISVYWYCASLCL
ncbi:hypothetical protein [Adhaeribacter aquaticus]|uniref:hypothetical protein n=1 Tax=Adhaeribacter aquaticus TaxID=299567 RepID=UPI00146FB8BA|nr:hypothetical protein [Adhaeribacter aquaticus]